MLPNKQQKTLWDKIYLSWYYYRWLYVLLGLPLATAMGGGLGAFLHLYLGLGFSIFNLSPVILMPLVITTGALVLTVLVGIVIINLAHAKASAVPEHIGQKRTDEKTYPENQTARSNDPVYTTEAKTLEPENSSSKTTKKWNRKSDSNERRTDLSNPELQLKTQITSPEKSDENESSHNQTPQEKEAIQKAAQKQRMIHVEDYHESEERQDNTPLQVVPFPTSAPTTQKQVFPLIGNQPVTQSQENKTFNQFLLTTQSHDLAITPWQESVEKAQGLEEDIESLESFGLVPSGSVGAFETLKSTLGFSRYGYSLYSLTENQVKNLYSQNHELFAKFGLDENGRLYKTTSERSRDSLYVTIELGALNFNNQAFERFIESRSLDEATKWYYGNCYYFYNAPLTNIVNNASVLSNTLVSYLKKDRRSDPLKATAPQFSISLESRTYHLHYVAKLAAQFPQLRCQEIYAMKGLLFPLDSENFMPTLSHSVDKSAEVIPYLPETWSEALAINFFDVLTSPNTFYGALLRSLVKENLQGLTLTDLGIGIKTNTSTIKQEVDERIKSSKFIIRILRMLFDYGHRLENNNSYSTTKPIHAAYKSLKDILGPDRLNEMLFDNKDILNMFSTNSDIAITIEDDAHAVKCLCQGIYGLIKAQCWNSAVTLFIRFVERYQYVPNLNHLLTNSINNISRTEETITLEKRSYEFRASDVSLTRIFVAKQPTTSYGQGYEVPFQMTFKKEPSSLNSGKTTTDSKQPESTKFEPH